MRNKNLYTLLAVFVLAAMALSACGSAATTTPPVVATSVPIGAPTTAATQVQGNQNNGGGTGSGNIQWPSAMPADVPVFTYGTITGANNDILGSVQATFENVTSDAFDKYQSDLKNAGWTISNATQSAYGFEIDATIAPRTVVAMFITSKNNGLTGAVTYTAH
jgi:hypothetical protein